MRQTKPVYIIAEAGVNHNGSLERALKLVDCAAESGADVVKFQAWTAEGLVSVHAQKAEYQKRTTGAAENQFDMLRKLQLSESDHHAIIERCKAKGIQYLCSPFDSFGLEFLAVRLNVPRLKIPSGEITNAPFLFRAASLQKQLILSTGMCTLADIEAGLSVVAFGYLHPGEKPTEAGFRDAYRSEKGKQLLRERVVLLHCTTEYPAPFADVNLRAMDTLRDTFGLEFGYSDHTPGIEVPIAAVARGATVIEKHFTLDRNLPGPDHHASLEPQELRAMVKAIRNVEASLGSPEKVAAPSEVKNIVIARKSLVALRDVKKGELFTEANLTTKRPGSGISPMRFWEYLGKPASRDYRADEII